MCTDSCCEMYLTKPFDILEGRNKIAITLYIDVSLPFFLWKNSGAERRERKISLSLMSNPHFPKISNQNSTFFNLLLKAYRNRKN